MEKHPKKIKNEISFCFIWKSTFKLVPLGCMCYVSTVKKLLIFFCSHFQPLEDAAKNDPENSVEVDENQIKLAKEVEAAAKAEKAKLKKTKKKGKKDHGDSKGGDKVYVKASHQKGQKFPSPRGICPLFSHAQ